MRITVLSIFILFSLLGLAQNQVGINQPSVAPSAVLDMNSTTKGLLIPRMTTNNRNDIDSPAQGLVIYETSTNNVWYYNGAGWIKVIADSEPIDGLGDADSDTRVYLDFTNDNDQIRFFMQGNQHMRMNRQRFDVLNNGNSVVLGDSSAFNDDQVSNNSVYLGNSAGMSIVNGRSNVGVGYQALRDNVSGSDFIAIGNRTARLGTTARRSVVFGGSALRSNLTSNQHTLIGHAAAEIHTTNNNLNAIGIRALSSDVSGQNNVAIGTRSLSSLTNRNNNVAIGHEASTSAVSVVGTMCIGYRAGANNLFGNRFFIGNSSNSLLFGFFSIDEVIVFDDLHITENITYVGNLTDVSDKRLKEEIREEKNMLSKLTQLDGYRYHLKTSPKGELEYGLIAQEVKKVFPSLVRKIETKTGYIGVSYVQFIPLILQAEKEQFKQLNTLVKEESNIAEELDSLETELNAMKQRVLNEKVKLSDLGK